MMPLFEVLHSLSGVTMATLGIRMMEINTDRSQKSLHTFLYKTLLLRYRWGPQEPSRALLQGCL